MPKQVLCFYSLSGASGHLLGCAQPTKCTHRLWCAWFMERPGQPLCMYQLHPHSGADRLCRHTMRHWYVLFMIAAPRSHHTPHVASAPHSRLRCGTERQRHDGLVQHIRVWSRQTKRLGVLLLYVCFTSAEDGLFPLLRGLDKTIDTNHACFFTHRLPATWNYLALEQTRVSDNGDPDLYGLFDFGGAPRHPAGGGDAAGTNSTTPSSVFPTSDVSAYDFQETSSGLHPRVTLRVSREEASAVQQTAPAGVCVCRER